MPETIRELLQRTVEERENVYGYYRRHFHNQPESNSRVYSIPDAGFSGYLLRVPFDARIQSALESSTALYPVHLCNKNVGQILLHSGTDLSFDEVHRGFQIVARIPGTSLQDLVWAELARRKTGAAPSVEQEGDARLEVLRMLTKLPARSFENLLNDLHYLTKEGIEADLNPGNLLLDGNRIRIIDVRCTPTISLKSLHPPHPAYNNLHTLKRELFTIATNSRMTLSEGEDAMEHLCDRLYEAGEPEAVALLKTLSDKLDAAAAATHFPRTAEEAIETINSKRVAFKTLERIDTKLGSELPLEATPRELVAMLKEIAPKQR